MAKLDAPKVQKCLQMFLNRNSIKCSLTLLHSERPKLPRVLAVLSAIGLILKIDSFPDILNLSNSKARDCTRFFQSVE